MSTSKESSTSAMERLMNPQSASILFRALPQEIRDEIYAAYFDATLLIWGGPNDDGSLVKPAENALALLRTCHRVRAEIGLSWIGQVVFNFEHPDEMLDMLEAMLAAMPHDSISQIRHMRLFGDHVVLCTPGFGNGHPVEYILNSALEKYLGLRPDALRVSGTLKELPHPWAGHTVLGTYVNDARDGNVGVRDPQSPYFLYCGVRFPILLRHREDEPGRPKRALLAWRARRERPFSGNSSASNSIRPTSNRPQNSEAEEGLQNNLSPRRASTKIRWMTTTRSGRIEKKDEKPKKPL